MALVSVYRPLADRSVVPVALLPPPPVVLGMACPAISVSVGSEKLCHAPPPNSRHPVSLTCSKANAGEEVLAPGGDQMVALLPEPPVQESAPAASITSVEAPPSSAE